MFRIELRPRNQSTCLQRNLVTAKVEHKENLLPVIPKLHQCYNFDIHRDVFKNIHIN